MFRTRYFAWQDVRNVHAYGATARLGPAGGRLPAVPFTDARGTRARFVDSVTALGVPVVAGEPEVAEGDPAVSED